MHSPTAGKRILLEVGTNEVEFLEFGIGQGRYGVNVAKITQISVWKTEELTTLPTSDKVFLGTIVFRGRCIGVYDLREILDIEKKSEPDKQLLVVMEFNQRMYGFVIDSVYNIERISWSDFTPSTNNKVIAGHSSIIGTVTLKDRIILILDLEALMSSLDSTASIEGNVKKIKKGNSEFRKNLHVVYCEDSSTIRTITLNALRDGGYEKITSFPTASEGLRYLNSTNGEGVDLILSDIEMPELDGLSFCKAVKNNPILERIPFIFFSSLINDQMKAKCALVRADTCFSKPEIHLVADAIENLVTEKALRND